MNGLCRYRKVGSEFFEPVKALNFGIKGDRTQHVLWRDTGQCRVSGYTLWNKQPEQRQHCRNREGYDIYCIRGFETETMCKRHCDRIAAKSRGEGS